MLQNTKTYGIRNMFAVIRVFSCLPFLWVFFLFPAAEAAPEVLASYEKGKELFEQKCSACHTIGAGKKVGPDLKGITEKRKRDWLLGWIDDPQKMIKSGDVVAGEMVKGYAILMPSSGLSEEEINDVLSYLEAQKPASSPAIPAEFRKEPRPQMSLNSRTYLQFHEDARGNRYAPLSERVDLEIQDRDKKWTFQSSGALRYDIRTLSGLQRELDELTYAFLSFAPFSKSGPGFRIGRSYIFGGVAACQFDGIQSLWEITPSAGLSVFGGRPVETEFDGKHGDYVYGGRLYHRIEKKAEVGVSYLKEDNSTDRYREELGLDIWLLPTSALELQGHSYWNAVTEGWMEHYYTLRLPLERFVISGFIGKADYHDAFWSSNLSAFSPDRVGRNEGLTKMGASVEYRVGKGVTTVFSYTGYDYRQSGEARYYGGMVTAVDRGLSAGLSAYRMEGDLDRLRYLEVRAFFKKSYRNMTLILDAVNLHYDQPVSGLSDAYSFSGGLLYRISNALSLGMDIDYHKNPDFTSNTMALVKLLYNFRKDL